MRREEQQQQNRRNKCEIAVCIVYRPTLVSFDQQRSNWAW